MCVDQKQPLYTTLYKYMLLPKFCKSFFIYLEKKNPIKWECLGYEICILNVLNFIYIINVYDIIIYLYEKYYNLVCYNYFKCIYYFY